METTNDRAMYVG